MKCTIITVCLNSEQTIQDTIDSVLSQDYPDIEYIIIDGGSTDGTRTIVNGFSNRLSHFVSEKDRGIYDAMNKGISLATGDIVGILNSDDVYSDSEVVSRVIDEFRDKKPDCVYADLIYVGSKDMDKIVRFYDASGFGLQDFQRGHQPPHPTCFIKKACYDKYGSYKSEYRIAADFELLARFFWKHRIKTVYLNKTLVKMRYGGVSTAGLGSTLTLNREILKACRENGIPSNYLKIYSKYLFKVFQLIRRPG